MAALIPKGAGASTGGVTAHSALTGLQGGIVGEYYHLTATEYASLSGALTGARYEPLLATGSGNTDVVYIAGTSIVPDFLLSTAGDFIMGIGA